LFGAEALGIERQETLQAQQDVAEQQRGQRKQQQRARVGGPPHILLGVDADYSKGAALEPAETVVEKGPFTFEYARQVRAERLRQQQQESEKEDDLQRP
jgi:hypothetical protein